MRSDSWLFVFRTAPKEGGLTADGLDLCLVSAAFGFDLKVLFVGEGVFHIVKPEVSVATGRSLPPYTKTFKALSDFDIEQRFVLKQSLDRLSLHHDDLTVESALIEAREMRSLLNSVTQVFDF